MRGRCGANSTYVYYVNSKIRRKNINEAVDLRAKSLKNILQLASYSIIATMAKRIQGSLINFGFTKKLCSDDVNSTTDSPAASSVSTPPAGVTTQEEAEEIKSSLAEDGGGNSSSEAGHNPKPSCSSLPLNWNSQQWRDWKSRYT